MTVDEKIALARAPITVGILAAHVVGGKASGGAGTDGSRMPIRNDEGYIVGSLRQPMKSHNS